MNTLRFAVIVLGPTLAVVAAASCSPVPREDPRGSGGAGGGTTTTSSGMLTTGAEMTTSTEATTGGGGGCADTQADPANCGACGHDCTTQANPGTATCAAGVCAFTCEAGFLDCNVGADDGCETDPVNDPLNCNGCGSVCGLTQTCAASSCADTFTSCDEVGTCPDPTCQDLNHFSVDAEVAVDVQFGRMLWQRSSKGPLDYTAAADYCANATFSGVSGWRLPTQTELANLVYNAGGQDGCAAPNCNPAVDQAVFADTFSDDYWTSDPFKLDSHYCLSFCTGFAAAYTTSEHYVRCTHDPLP